MRPFAFSKIAAIAGLICFTPLVSKAAEKPAATVVAEPVAPVSAEDLVQARKIALLDRYFKAMHFDEMMAMMTKSMVPAMLEELRKQQPKMSDADYKVAVDVVTESMQELTPLLVAETSKVYAEVFSEEELSQIVAFYEGPVGQNLVEKSPALMAKTGDLVRVLIPQMQASLAEKMCRKTNCKQKAAKPKAG